MRKSSHLRQKWFRIRVLSRRRSCGVCSWILLSLFSATAGFAATNNTVLGLRISSETGPVGNMVQVKIFATTPQIIAGGSLFLTFDGSSGSENVPQIIAGEVFSATGDASGIAYTSDVDGYIVTFGSPSGSVGRLPGLPLAELTIMVDKPHTVGLNLARSYLVDSQGSQLLDSNAIQTGSIAVGGTLTVQNAYPGGGIVPAGLAIQISGSGFTPNTTVAIDGASVSSVSFASSTLIAVTLAAPIEMTGKHILVQNPDGEQVDYWSWLHGNGFSTTIFPSSISTTSASCTPQTFPGAGVYLDLQNPSATPIDVTVTNLGNGVSSQPTTTVVVPSWSIYNARGATAGAIPVEHDITSSAPIQVWCEITGFDLSAENLTLAPINYIAPPLPTMASIANAASLRPGTVSPGEIVTIFGYDAGPTSPASFQLDDSGNVPRTLAGTRVLFDGVPAPILYSSASQVNAVVPYEIAGEAITRVQLEYNGTLAAAWGIPVASAAPAIFTQSATGQGLAAVLNQDHSLNTASNPAARGSVIQIFATGEGQTVPPGVTGGVTGAGTKTPVAKTSVTVGGVDAPVQFVGEAPGSVSGLLQVNALVPASIIPGAAVPISISIGGVQSPDGVTISVN